MIWQHLIHYQICYQWFMALSDNLSSAEQNNQKISISMIDIEKFPKLLTTKRMMPCA